jgi:AraC-like DNA-binding protein
MTRTGTITGRPGDDAWKSIDPLGEALHFLRMSGVVYTRSELAAPWGLELPAMPDCLMFHAVTAGHCLLEADGAEPRLLRSGDFALVPHGEGHIIRSAAGAPAAKLFDLPREQVGERYEVLRHGGGGEATMLVCGAVRFDHPAALRLLQLLPRLIRLDSWQQPHAERVHGTLRLMAAELSQPHPGGEAVITRLADILVVQTIRAWIEKDGGAQTGWLAALRDRQIGRAIALVHREPEKRWSVAGLAREVAMSRSAFSARFTALVGEPPMHYLTRWRMQLALNWLREGDRTAATVARRLGYDSEAAFSRAFKRYAGVPPGAVRRRRAASAPPSPR